MPVLSIVYN